ncbi:hypothetical protein WA026_013291 [Henosepilachna vigintioctopunctata]|uniref:Uncharacterized protein n=1 Tax=Henosepilachna vigintioctopunctata TaxID=420089 RepID=A0AAW1V5I3_9CUCU
MASQMRPRDNEDHSGDLTVNQEVDAVFSVSRTHSLSIMTATKPTPQMVNKNTDIQQSDFYMRWKKPEYMKELDLNDPDIIFAINLGLQIQAISDVTGTIKPKLRADLQCLVDMCCETQDGNQNSTF